MTDGEANYPEQEVNDMKSLMSKIDMTCISFGGDKVDARFKRISIELNAKFNTAVGELDLIEAFNESIQIQNV